MSGDPKAVIAEAEAYVERNLRVLCKALEAQSRTGLMRSRKMQNLRKLLRPVTTDYTHRVADTLVRDAAVKYVASIKKDES